MVSIFVQFSDKAAASNKTFPELLKRFKREFGLLGQQYFENLKLLSRLNSPQFNIKSYNYDATKWTTIAMV